MADQPPHLFRMRPPSDPAVAVALRAGEDAERRRRRRRVAAGLGLLLLLVGAGFGVRKWLEPTYLDHLRAERAGWRNVKFIAQEERTDPATGEVTMPYEGFGVFADSEPDGARVSSGGKVLGETPLATALPCAAGETLTLRFEKAGLPAREVQVRCRENAMVKLQVALRR
jgi:hypothetical protein